MQTKCQYEILYWNFNEFTYQFVKKILTNENLGNIKIAQNRCFVSGLVCQFIRDETPSFTIPGTYVPNNL